MSPLREAFLVPGLFLTVAWLGGLRVDAAIRLVPPPLAAIVLAVALISALVRAGVVVPQALLNADRRPIENVSGFVVLLTLFAASSQAINLLVPDRGLLHFAFVAFLFVQLLSLSAAGIGRAGMLRSLFVLFGAAFVLRFIVLESLYAADGGTLQRVLTALMAGVTLGGIEYHPHAPVTGYVAFVTLSVYLAGLVLLPARPARLRPGLVPIVRDGLPVPFVLLAIAVASACSGSPASTGAQADATPASADSRRAAAERDAMLASARVWMPPSVPPGSVDFGVNPPGPFGEGDDVECRLVVERVGGLTPKFNCQLADGTLVKVKYGRANAELYTEVVATRLLAALGFPADRMYVVRSVRCAGCPRFPYPSLRCLAASGLEWPCFPAGVDFDRVRTFDAAVIERRLEGRKIEAHSDQGWAWYELDAVDQARGGSPRAHVDGLKLLAAFLAHWDNKAENQRLICMPEDERPGGGCARPLAMLQDVGGTFGPSKLDLPNWRATPVWQDARTCRVSMEALPFEGATFPEQHISEEGRRFLLGLLEQLSTAQIETLFTASRATAFDAGVARARSAQAWSAVFTDKIRQIREGGPCQ